MDRSSFPTRAEFERLAGEAFDRIPVEFRSGIASLTVRPDQERHPTIPDWFTLGYCEAYLPSLYAEDDASVVSEIVLYYGSFRAIASRDVGFDVEAELWETLTHEVRHHLEHRAGVMDLDAEDYALEQDQLRRQGLPYEPFYFHAGEELAPDLYRVDLDLYLEVALGEHEWSRRPGTELTLEWNETRRTVIVPDRPSDGLTYVAAGASPYARGGHLGELWLVWVIKGWNTSPPR